LKIVPSQKMSYFQPAIFGQLKECANEQKAKGAEIIDLSLGSPDLPPHEILRNHMAEKSKDPSAYGYTLTGTKEFNEAVARYYKRVNKVEIDPETEVLLTMGSQEGLVHLPIAFCDPGDIVLITNPAYVAYIAGIHLAGAQVHYIPLDKERGYLPDLEAISEEVARKAKLMILNLPGNPVPAMPSFEYFTEVVEFAEKYNIIVLHDAAYSEFYFSGDGPISFLNAPGAKEVGMEINSLSKSFSLAGARVAYFVGNRNLIQIMKQLKSNLDYGVFEPIQSTAALALDHSEMITDRLRKIFSERHRVVTKGLDNIGWEYAPSSGGMFVWAKYPFDIDSVNFAFQTIEQTGVVMVPGTSFGSEGEGYVRIALVQEKERLEEAIKRLEKLKI